MERTPAQSKQVGCDCDFVVESLCLEMDLVYSLDKGEASETEFNNLSVPNEKAV